MSGGYINASKGKRKVHTGKRGGKYVMMGGRKKYIGGVVLTQHLLKNTKKAQSTKRESSCKKHLLMREWLIES